MSFTDLIRTLAILAVIFGGLYASKSANRKEENVRLMRRKSRDLQNDLADNHELLHTLMLYDCNTDLLESLHSRMLTDFNQGLRLLPSNGDFNGDLEAFNTFKIQIEQLRDNPVAPAIPSSDRQIFLLKKHFTKAITLLGQMKYQGDIDERASDVHRVRLRINSLLLEVSAYHKQGDDAKAEGDVDSAGRFYKYSKDILIKTELRFDDRNPLMQVLSSKITTLYSVKRTPKTDDQQDKQEDLPPN
jgi:hypothetical protein